MLPPCSRSSSTAGPLNEPPEGTPGDDLMQIVQGPVALAELIRSTSAIRGGRGDTMAKSLALFRRFPRLQWRPKEGEQIVPREVQATYPALAEDFALLEHELLPHFRELDNAALHAQNQFRLEQVALILGGTLATVLGAMQTLLLEAVWPGIAEAVLASGLTAVAFRAQALRAQERYFTNRLKAETLRGEYFRFLGRIGPYAEDREPIQQLRRRVAEVKAGEPRR
jgi:hypothetical protein